MHVACADSRCRVLVVIPGIVASVLRTELIKRPVPLRLATAVFAAKKHSSKSAKALSTAALHSLEPLSIFCCLIDLAAKARAHVVLLTAEL